MIADTQLTMLLQAWAQGDSVALDRLMPLIYGELRKLARFHMSREAADHILQPTALIHEAFLKLADMRHAEWKGRKHFYGSVSQIMRRILVDYARKKRSVKRGPEAKWVPFEEAKEEWPAEMPVLDVVVFDSALRRLETIDARKAHVVELWFFTGLTVEQIAHSMDVGTSTVNRYLKFSKTWLAREMGNIVDP